MYFCPGSASAPAGARAAEHSSNMMSMTKITKRASSPIHPPLLSFDTSMPQPPRKSRHILAADRKLCGDKVPRRGVSPCRGILRIQGNAMHREKQPSVRMLLCVILCLVVLIRAELRQRQAGVFLLRPADAPLIVENEQVVAAEVLHPLRIRGEVERRGSVPSLVIQRI